MFDDDKLIATHLGDDYDKFLGAVVPPVFMTSLHVFNTMEEYLNHDKFEEYVYGRVSNPTVKIVENKIAAMEHGAYGLLFSSGMAVITSVIAATCKTGSHIISLKNCYGPIATYLNQIGIPKLNMSVTYVDASYESVVNAIQPNTDFIILESPTSLVFEVIDIERIANVAKEKNIRTYIDNTYCSPLYQKPIELGIDFSMHSASKYLGGHSDLIGGALVCATEELGKQLLDIREMYGGIMGPQEAWLVMRGIRTLDVRLERHQKTALSVAKYLEKHPRINKVNYPGLESHPNYELAQKQQKGNSGLLSFEFNGSKEEAVAFCNKLKIFKIGVSWGGFESLVVMPMYKITEEQAKAQNGSNSLVRIHCGLEGTENLIADLEQALTL